MARPRKPQPVKLFCGLLGGDLDLLRRARQLLGKSCGPVDLESDVWDFTQTDYYRDEMGSELKRQFIAFDTLMGPQRLAEIKVETNAIEQRLAEDCVVLDVARPVNLDPGYVDLGKLVLATTKDRAHRIYMDHGIYAEVTLQFAGGGWQPAPWTYPDYRAPHYHEFFTRVRSRLYEQRQALEALASAEAPRRATDERFAVGDASLDAFADEPS